MSNVAIKLVAVAGVVGLGVLMFLQAQKGIQSGSLEQQMSQLNPLDSEQTSDPTELSPDDSDSVALDQVPAELSELAARDALPLKAEKSKKDDSPFAPNSNSPLSKIKLTAATDEPAIGDHESAAASEFEPAEKAELLSSAKGLDFREPPEMKTPDPSENPFTIPAETPVVTQKEVVTPSTPVLPEFDAGPQFGPVTTADAATIKENPVTHIPPREAFTEVSNLANPFGESADKKPVTFPEPDRENLEPETEEIPFSPGSLPPKMELSENSPEPVESIETPTPAIELNPFGDAPKNEPKPVPVPTLEPETPALTPTIEPEFNPFQSETATAPAKPAMEPTFNSTATPEPEPVKLPETQPVPFTVQPAGKIESKPVPVQEESDVVIIKKRQPESNLQEPPLFPIEGKGETAHASQPQPIEISPAEEPKPLSLIEGNQALTREPTIAAIHLKTQSPKMTIQKMAPPEAVLGQPFIYHVLVKNSGTTSAQSVIVEDRIPKGAKLTGTIPRAEQIEDRIIWRLGEMGPGAEKKISIRVIPEHAGQIGSVATVNFVTEVASETKITSPRLVIKSDQPEAVKPGEIAVVNYTITNNGTGDAKNVFVRSIIPPQFTHPGGDDLEYSVGIIPAGETKQIQLQLKAVKPGAGKNISSVVGDGNLKAETEVPLKVIGNGEQFLLTRKGPKNRYLGSKGEYENSITNNTEKTIENISIFESIPPGMKFLSASANGKFDQIRKVVQWDLKELPAGSTQALKVELEPTEVGKMISTLQVVTDNNTQFSANLQSETVVIGQPLLKVETSELKGPLEVGEKMAMQVQLINQGSASATNVEFRIKIPQELVFVAAKGPGRYQQAGSYIIFEPAQELAAKQTLNFELTLVARNKGDARVLVQVQSKQMEKPLNQEEAIPILDKLQ
ncbi:DUF11 domain-containing protein [Gimesia algae]|uniref:Large cysteine-rich periplasmic protein OmcB n=1 Tax=Gimesia algae TaxID=2527971 RepID=A0A517V7K4_9PLAN|nr:DUF11 domain-containing protein [Gimesia algae]QDT88993.1 Large cysteine-rich periplasmic protein OmcB precursor [Gimesia algae]